MFGWYWFRHHLTAICVVLELLAAVRESHNEMFTFDRVPLTVVFRGGIWARGATACVTSPGRNVNTAWYLKLTPEDALSFALDAAVSSELPVDVDRWP